MEVTRIWSVAGHRPPAAGLVLDRPFRAPHHSVSRAGLVGGGSALPRPGEISLAHRGILFLDELPEFSRDALESLRQPLEDGVVVVGRRQGVCLFPARFLLVAARNPCACGNLGSGAAECTCTEERLARYQARLSGPLLDRIDLQVPVLPLDAAAFARPRATGSSEAARDRVLAARRFREARLVAEVGASQSSPGALHLVALEKRDRLSFEARALLRAAVSRSLLGGRGYVRTLATARTIADLGLSRAVQAEHVAEALSLRVGG